MNGFRICLIALVITAVSLSTETASAENWPTYRHDVRRSGVTSESLAFPLRQSWVRRSPQAPQTAWTGPAKWDAYSGNSGLQSMRNFDPCFFVTAADDLVYFGSSVDDAVHALDASGGTERWVHFTNSAVRFPPTIDRGRAYFGSDDGFVYCCDRQTGELIWKRCASPANRMVTSNRKIISMWPVRTGVLVQDGKAIFGASLVPWNDSYLWKVDCSDGSVERDDCFQTVAEGVTLQGALLASHDRIYVPQGRAAPLSFDLGDGKNLGAIGEAGGVFCVLTEDEMLLAGPQHQKETDSQMRIADGRSRQRLATFSGTNRILVDGDHAWIPSGGTLRMLVRSSYVQAQIEAAKHYAIFSDDKITDTAIKQKAKVAYDAAQKQQDQAWKWQVDCPAPSGLIKTADAVIVGLDNEVRAFSAATGELRWKHDVEGVAHGLAVAAGRLFVSTGRGHIYAFESAE
ncbi:outer membrane biogenesis protein BamB [Stieleria maiorica]|uniref:Outer membrane biogenesis protein BamB n=1 Tax=Stieleria maiorica TaxID=2795974 RepID=A0A5B9M7H3_9BACT|nr:PQQ-binding-like beta-propeller repeat protein [Stieleria maiorica]QEF97111.1 outer membrane biogenesis protein BamB [Stieleria maiorica]